jgi:light-regulated signal transduction histidine kinase (bacteriophytochrome)
LVGDTVSRNIERLSLSQRLHARNFINISSTETNPGGYIVTRAEDLLSLFDADFGILSIGDEGKILGAVDNSQEVMAALQYLRMKRFTTIQISQDLRRDYPDFVAARKGFDLIAGLLLVPLSHEGRDFIVFFRQGQLQQVHWAGNPYEKLKLDSVGGLIPRKSFKVWSETVIDKCRDWTNEQLETAAVLHLVYGKFIEVWRQKEKALQSTRMASLLLNNASHEGISFGMTNIVRTPLNAIINYLEIALEGQLDAGTREHLVKSYAASKSLIYVINDLLDLTRTEAGNDLFRNEAFNLPATIQEAVKTFEHDPHRSKVELRVIVHPDLPNVVLGDQVKIRQVVSNVIANALKHTEEGNVTVEAVVINQTNEQVQVEISVSDTGSGISPRKLDAMFQNFEQGIPYLRYINDSRICRHRTRKGDWSRTRDSRANSPQYERSTSR